ncbi:MAG: hypothetical protein QM647_01975 [Asticcacaulis sp.]|uniref:hypothetical protein n=1 Tax=Asticcacaulis sp. TaxID=1872648 RepID=UPI0039E57CD5
MERKHDDLAQRKLALKLRLAVQVEKLVTDIEALTEPKTPLEAERMAKALKAADAAIEQIFKGAEDSDEDTEEEEMNDDWTGRDWRAELERKLHRLADARRDHGLGGEPAGRTEAAGRSDAVGVLGERTSEGPAGGLA